MPYTFTLVQLRYQNRLEYEDGPGSLHNVASDRSERVMQTWVHKAEDFGQAILQGKVSLVSDRPGSAQGGWIEYSYELRRRLEEDGAKEEYVGYVDSHSTEEGDDYGDDFDERDCFED